MRLLAALILAVPCVARAQANPDSPENITVTATRVPTTVENLPAGVTVIDRKTIEDRGYVSLVDALQAVPGLRVAQSGGPGSQASVFVRGTNSNHVLVLIDGVPVNDPGDPGGAFNFGVDTLADVERIEIVRGPISSLYGTGAIGGVINLITRRGKGAPHGHVTLAAGAPRAGLAQGDVSGGVGIYDYAAQIQGLSEYGFDQTPRRESVYTGEPDGDRGKLAQIELGATPLADTRFSLLLRARDAKYGFDEAYGVTYDGGNATGYDAALFGRAGVTSTFFGGAWDTSLYVSRLQTDRRYTITLDAADPNQAVGDSRYHGRRTDTQWNNTVRLPDEGAFTANSMTFGFEQQSDQSDTNINSFYTGFGSFNTDRETVHAHDDTQAGYLGMQSTALGRLALTGQLREDATSIAGDAFTWRAGGVLDLSELSSHVHASYGTSFRAPALFDRYGIDVANFGGFGSIYRGNPNLQPEHAQGYEAGWTLDVPWGAARSASLGATYFDNRIRDLIEEAFAPDGSTATSINLPRARSHGVETVLTLRAAPWVQADVTYTYTDTRNLGDNTQLLRRPYNQWSVNLRLVPVRGVVIAPELLYVGAFQDFLAGDDGAPGAFVGRSPSGLIFNLNATWQVTPSIELFAWGKNLGDSRFEPVSGYVTPGASVLAGTKLSF